jgi:hypothetical protein
MCYILEYLRLQTFVRFKVLTAPPLLTVFPHQIRTLLPIGPVKILPCLTDSDISARFFALGLSIALMMVVVRTTETSVYFNETARCSVPCCCHLLRTNMSPHSSTFSLEGKLKRHYVPGNIVRLCLFKICSDTNLSSTPSISRVPIRSGFPTKIFQTFLINLCVVLALSVSSSMFILCLVKSSSENIPYN